MDNVGGKRPAAPQDRQPRLAAGRARALGVATRGTTHPNRLRRMDNWIAAELAGRLAASAGPLVIDLGYGATPITAVELLCRLRAIRPDVEVLGLELDAARVLAAQPASGHGLRFARGGFELAGQHPRLVRVANVLRQYPESAVAGAWQVMRRQLAPGGAIVEGTCDELGRRASWVLLDAAGPISLTLSCRPTELGRPSDIAPRLVKALIHRNVAGEPIHALLRAMDLAWDQHASLAAFGNRQRWQAMCAQLRGSWPVLGAPSRHRLGELTVAWSAVAPRE
ncbi:MAG: class I SAM-dependent methyltransferase [Jatrophihabitans sp.]